jgi:hypothetical protein
MIAHTPGPWRVGDHRSLSVDIRRAKKNDGPTAIAIAAVHAYSGKPEDLDECEANARLIAAAPDMAFALQFIADNKRNFESDNDALLAFISMAATTLAKVGL